MQVSTGSIDNIKPEFVLNAIYERCGLAYDPLAIQIHRQEVYAKKTMDHSSVCLTWEKKSHNEQDYSD